MNKTSVPLESCRIHNEEVLNWIESNKPTYVFISNNDPEKSIVGEFISSASTINKYSEAIYFGQIPIFPDSDSFQQSRLLWQRPYTAPKSYRVEAMNESSLLSAKMGKQFARKMGVKFVDLTEVFCDFNYCWRFKDKKWLYFDTSHLSVQGADLLFNPIFRALEN